MHVYFQPKAWADPAFSVAWAKRTFLPAVAATGTSRAILFTDGLAGQSATTGQFKSTMAEGHPSVNTLVWNFPPGCTDEVQPVDAGYGFEVIREVGRVQMQWLDRVTDGVANIDLWESDSESRGSALDASDRRVLLTMWVADAVAIVNAKKSRRTGLTGSFAHDCFVRTGTSMTLTGQDDHLIKLEGYEQLEEELGPLRFMDVPYEQPRVATQPDDVPAAVLHGAAAHGVNLAHDTGTGADSEVVTRELRMELEDTLDACDLKAVCELLNVAVDVVRVLTGNRETGQVLVHVQGRGWLAGTFFGLPTASQRARDPSLTHRVRLADGIVAICANGANRATAPDQNDQRWAFVTAVVAVVVVPAAVPDAS